jgi:arsenite/tail-anchored protein-transporting ATPase
MISLFAGKGGVGKTSCAAATAIHQASMGKRTLAISTDATPSLSHIFGVSNTSKPAKVQENLYFSELGLREVKDMWERKFGKEVFRVFSAFVSIEYQDFLDFMTSLLPGLFDEFMVDYIRELAREKDYEIIIWDTAPLGQTLTLLQMPSLVLSHLRMAPRVYSNLRRTQEKESLMDIIKKWRELSEVNIGFLQHEVDFTIVTIPEALAIQQLDGVFSELNKFGFRVKQIIVNNVIKSQDSEFLKTKAKEQAKYLQYLRDKFGYLPMTELPLFPHELKGLKRLEEAANALFESREGSERFESGSKIVTSHAQ